MTSENTPTLKLVLPKGRIQEKVLALLGNIGVNFLWLYRRRLDL